MNKNFYKKKCMAFIFSTLFLANFSYAQEIRNSGRFIRGEAQLGKHIEKSSGLKSDVKPAQRPMSPTTPPNPKGGSDKVQSVPGNDDCFNAIMLNVGTSCIGTNADEGGATESLPASTCSGWTSVLAEDVWFQFVATSADQTILVTESSDFDAVVELFDDCGGNSIDCSDNTFGGGNSEQIMASGLSPGLTYYVRVYYYGSAPPFTTTFDICVFETPPPPVNDECSGAISINVAATEAACSYTSVNTNSATHSMPDPFCAGVSNDDDVWYKFVAPNNVIIAKASNLGAGVSGVGFVLYEDLCTGTESIECTVQATNDRLDFRNLIVGHTYYLRTFTTSTGFGTFDLCVFIPPPPPVNDECAGAISIAPAASKGACSPISVNTVSATHSLPDPTCASSSNDDDVWYKFVATDSTMTAEASNLGTGVSGVGFVIYADSCDGAQSIECTTMATNNKQSFPKLTIGKTYFLKTFTTGTGYGAFDLCIYRTPPPANDDCSNAISITANGSSCNSVKADVDGAYQSLPPVNCNGTTSYSAMDVWFKFVAAAKKQTIMVAGSASFDPVVEILDGCGGSTVNCSDKNYGNGTIETLKDTALTIGKTYYVRVYSYGSTPGTTDFDICIYKTPNPPANDSCGGAKKIIPSSSALICQATTVNTVSATQSSPNPSCTSSDNDDDVWYFFTANDTTMTVKSMNYSAGISSVGFVVYADSCGGVQSMECSSMAAGGAQTFNHLVIGNTYLLRTFTYGTNVNGTFDICLIPGLPIAKNDECVNAIPISVNSSCTPTIGDVLGATESLTPIDCGTGQSSAANDVWFSFVADENNATINVKSSLSFDAIAEMFDGCGGAAIGCSDNTFTAGVENIVNSNITKGNTYYVRVYSYGSSMPTTSTFDICVTSQVSVGLPGLNTDRLLSVFPNPAQSELNVRFVSPSENSLSLRIYNAAGQMVYIHSSGQFTGEFNRYIPLEGFSKGFYLIQLVTETGVYNQKVTIN